MNRKVRRKVNNKGQVTLEYFLLSVFVVASAALVWMFYQGFVSGNLYGGQGFSEENKALGLEQVVSRPFP